MAIEAAASDVRKYNSIQASSADVLCVFVAVGILFHGGVVQIHSSYVCALSGASRKTNKHKLRFIFNTALVFVVQSCVHQTANRKKNKSCLL